MKKRMLTKTLIAAALLTTAGGAAMAGQMSQSPEAIQRQMQELIDQNRLLSQRVGELEGKMTETSSRTAEQLKALETREEKTDPAKISDYVTLSGVIEVEMAAGDDFAGDNFSSIDLATAELGLDIKATDWAAGRLLLKYEDADDEDHFFIDEAFILLGDTERFPLSLTAGKFYMPFGNFATNMISDPLTLEIGEINDAGLSLGFESHGFSAALYGYKGMNETGSSDTIKGFGAMAGYGYKQDAFSVNGGLSWINNIADSDGVMADAFDDAGLDSIQKHIGGLGAHLGIGYGPVSLIGEYIRALDQFAFEEVPFLDRGAEPDAWNVELAYTMELLSRETVFAVGWQKSGEALALGLPESRYLGSIGMEILPMTTLTLEYARDKDYNEADGGSNEKAHVATAQLAYQF